MKGNTEMNFIITIGREFGSGGRELGKRLSDELHIPYYDKEILEEVKKRSPYGMTYIEEVSEKRPYSVPTIHYGNSFLYYKDVALEQNIDVHSIQNDILKEVATKSSCVIIGRGADYTLRDLKPFSIFVYADMESKVRRCREREQDGEHLTDRQLIKNIKAADKVRRNFYEFYTGKKWGDKASYDLMINTTDVDIKKMAKRLAVMIKDLYMDEQ